ncbi:MAG TPA: hypothetical protein ENI17_10540 [Pseudomonas xinjiangensis]|uniref:Uncharacterized protein n=2 Tax=root TaxID=1 RepID=A0A7V1BPK2_9GAMM|nr:hypothetical protein [Halopseudomonas xinjiangensis]HEC48052.1 hypothetical protein [Halopseudomonas xinjiangensis]
MLIPGLPTVGTQQDAIKPKRGVQPTAKSEVVHEAKPESVERRRRDKGRKPERRRGRRRARAVEYTLEGVVETFPEMPTKGLLVDIEV